MAGVETQEAPRHTEQHRLPESQANHHLETEQPPLSPAENRAVQAHNDLTQLVNSGGMDWQRLQNSFQYEKLKPNSDLKVGDVLKTKEGSPLIITNSAEAEYFDAKRANSGIEAYRKSDGKAASDSSNSEKDSGGSKPDIDKALRSTDAEAVKLGKERHLSTTDLAVARYGIQSVLKNDVNGVNYFAAYLKGNPDADKIGETFSGALKNVGIDARVTTPQTGDARVNFGRLIDSHKDVAETVTFSSTGLPEAMNRVLPPRDPRGPRSPLSDSPRRPEDVLKSVVTHALRGDAPEQR